MPLPLQHTPHASSSSETTHLALATHELVIVGMKVRAVAV
jgi:hypothetical protein